MTNLIVTKIIIIKGIHFQTNGFFDFDGIVNELTNLKFIEAEKINNPEIILFSNDSYKSNLHTMLFFNLPNLQLTQTTFFQDTL